MTIFTIHAPLSATEVQAPSMVISKKAFVFCEGSEKPIFYNLRGLYSIVFFWYICYDRAIKLLLRSPLTLGIFSTVFYFRLFNQNHCLTVAVTFSFRFQLQKFGFGLTALLN